MISNFLQAQTYYAIGRKANTYHVNFHLRVVRRFVAFLAILASVPAKLTAQLGHFRTAVSREDDFFKLITKSDLTAVIEEWDTKRDNNTSSLRYVAQAYARNPADVQKQSDGQHILDLMNHYDLDISNNYEQQGSNTLQFCQAVDASSTYQAALASIGATAFYNGLKAANDQCIELIDLRNEQRSQAPHLYMADLRKRTDEEYADLIKLANAYALTADDDDLYAPLLNVLNEDVNYYEKTVFAGSGSSSSSGSNGSGGGSSNSGSSSSNTSSEGEGSGGNGGNSGGSGNSGNTGTGGNSGGDSGNSGDAGGSGGTGGDSGGDSGGGDGGGGSDWGNGSDE